MKPADATPGAPFLSIVLPVFNEVDNLRPLQARIDEALADFARGFEVIYVDDGSSDGSVGVLAELAAADPKVHSVLLRRNFGQTAAISAGIDAARGEVIAFLDADGQNDPRDLPMMIDKLDEGMTSCRATASDARTRSSAGCSPRGSRTR